MYPLHDNMGGELLWAQALLHLRDYTIHSCCGVQQGEPLGPLEFAFTLHPIIEKIKQEVPGLLINARYLDDGTLCGLALPSAFVLLWPS